MIYVHWPHTSEYTVCMLSARYVLRLTYSSTSFSQIRVRVLLLPLAGSFGMVSVGRERFSMASLAPLPFLKVRPTYSAISLLRRFYEDVQLSSIGAVVNVPSQVFRFAFKLGLPDHRSSSGLPGVVVGFLEPRLRYLCLSLFEGLVSPVIPPGFGGVSLVPFSGEAIYPRVF
jgi:hypothetical protein